MRRYMWPNSCLPSATVLIDAAYAASKGRFTLEGVENHAPRTCPRRSHAFGPPSLTLNASARSLLLPSAPFSLSIGAP